MSTSNRQQVIDALKHLKANPNNIGICDALYRIEFKEPQQEPYRHKVFSIINKWPKHSGHRLYPVADLQDKTQPELQYENAINAKTMYDAKTAYGALRLELIDYIISALEAEQ